MTSALGRRRTWPWIVGGIVAVLVLVGGVVTAVVVASHDDGSASRSPAPESCPEVGAALDDGGDLAWSVEDDDGDGDDVTLDQIEPLCGGVLVTWEVWNPNDDERETPDEYEYVAYDLAGTELWKLELDSDDVTTLTALPAEQVVLVNDEEHDELTALDAWTGEEKWQIDVDERIAMRDPLSHYPGVVLADAEPGLGTDSGILDLATGEITELEGHIAALAPDGPLMIRDGELTYSGLDGRERWSIAVTEHLQYRLDFHDSLDVAVGERVLAMTLDDYDLESEGQDDDDRLVAFDLETGEKRWTVPDITTTFPGPDGAIGAVRRPNGAQERVHSSADRTLPGEVVLLDESGETRSASFLKATNDWENTHVEGVGYFLTDVGTGAVLDAELTTLTGGGSTIAGFTTEGFATVEGDDELTLRSWSDGAEIRTITVQGLEAADPNELHYRWSPSGGAALVLDGAVLAYEDGVLRCYRRVG